MSDKKTATMASEDSVWLLDCIDPIVGKEYKNLRVATAEIVERDGDTKLRLELQAEIDATND